MLPKSKLPAALWALHHVLVEARSIAGAQPSHDKLFQILDWAEVLPTVIASRSEDTTDEFRSLLTGLGEQHPEFAGILADFDRGMEGVVEDEAD